MSPKLAKFSSNILKKMIAKHIKEKGKKFSMNMYSCCEDVATSQADICGYYDSIILIYQEYYRMS